MIDGMKLEDARKMLAIANDGDRSVVERAIALEYAYTGVYKACGTPSDISHAESMLGIPEDLFVEWSAAHSIEMLQAMIGSIPNDECLKIKARAIVMELFPEVAKGMVDHE